MPTPSQVIDLTLWKITLPIQRPSDPTRPLEVYFGPDPGPHNPNYEHPDWFKVVGDEVVFTCPVKGVRTTNSKYPRCELREMQWFPDANDGVGELDEGNGWGLSEGGRLEAICRILEYPVNNGIPGRIVIGQIHGSSDELCRLYYEGGEVYFKNDRAYPSGNEEQFNLATGVSIGDKIHYIIEAKNDTLVVTIHHNNTTYISTTQISSSWANDRFYFKAGCYLNSNDVQGFVGQGSVAFSNIVFSHENIVVEPPVEEPPVEEIFIEDHFIRLSEIDNLFEQMRDGSERKAAIGYLQGRWF